MNAQRTATSLSLLAVLMASAGLACSHGGGSSAMAPSKDQDLTGVWAATSAVSIDGCGLSPQLAPIGFPTCGITQQGASLTMVCSQTCGTGCTSLGGIRSGDDVTFTASRTVVLNPNCTLQIAETDATSFGGGILSGEATLHVSASGTCGLIFPCLVKGSVILERFPSGTLFPACMATCP